MNTFVTMYQALVRDLDSRQAARQQEALLLRAWGQFWKTVVEGSQGLPADTAAGLQVIRHTIECARRVRFCEAAGRAAFAAALEQAEQDQTQMILAWCDGRGLSPEEITTMPQEVSRSSKQRRLPSLGHFVSMGR